MTTSQTLAEFLDRLGVVSDFRGSLVLHFDGEGLASWEKKECGKFPRDERMSRRRVIVRVSSEERTP